VLTVGIAGQLATGKSTVTSEFVRLGAILVSGDQIGRNLVETNKTIQRRLVAEFGRTILGRNGNIDRPRLADIAFSSRNALERLNRIVHPLLLKELKRQITAARESAASPMIVIDAALIFEWGLQRQLDATILVDAPRKLQLKLIEKKGITRRDALKRLRLQMPKLQQRQLADYAIRNDGSAAELRRKARRLYRELLQAYSGKTN